MCCPSRICCCCLCLALVAIAIGICFGFGVFKHGFDKLKHTFHESDTVSIYGGGATNYGGRPFFYNAPPLY